MLEKGKIKRNDRKNNMIDMYEGYQIIPDYIRLMKQPENIVDFLRTIANYIELGNNASKIDAELKEETRIKNIAIDIIKEHGFSDELNERCWR